jgi:hypothetical protein
MKSLSNCAYKTFLCFDTYPFYFVVSEKHHQQLFPGFGDFPLPLLEKIMFMFSLYTHRVLCTILKISNFFGDREYLSNTLQVALEIGTTLLIKQFNCIKSLKMFFGTVQTNNSIS